MDLLLQIHKSWVRAPRYCAQELAPSTLSARSFTNCPSVFRVPVVYLSPMSKTAKPPRAFNKIAVYGVLEQDGKFLLLRRQNTGYQDGNYSVPAGHLEPGELITDALAREAKEEVGVEIDPASAEFAHVAHRMEDSYADFFFTIDRWQGNVTNMEPEKCSDLSWHDKHNLPENIVPFIGLALRHIAERRQYSEYPTEPS
jgi:8-oxo-dGTP diphosphatase